MSDERWGIMGNNPKTPEWKKGKSPESREQAQEKIVKITEAIKDKTKKNQS